jgi:hypothetical protein
VGNALSGAPAFNQLGYFRYVPDPGDGTGIATALAEALALGFACDICIQEGTYTRAVGLARFVVPAGCRVWSPGGVNIITNAIDDCVFQLGAGASLERLSLTQRGVLGAAGAALVECPAGSATAKTQLRDLVLTTPVNVRGAQLVGGDFEVDNVRVFFTGGGAAPVGINIEGGANPAFFDVHDCLFSLVNIGVRFGFAGGGTAVRDSRIVNNRLALTAGIVPIAAGAGSERCTAALNVSRGSGSTLPTDAGALNQIAPGVSNTWGP